MRLDRNAALRSQRDDGFGLISNACRYDGMSDGKGWNADVSSLLSGGVGCLLFIIRRGA